MIELLLIMTLMAPQEITIGEIFLDQEGHVEEALSRKEFHLSLQLTSERKHKLWHLGGYAGQIFDVTTSAVLVCKQGGSELNPLFTMFGDKCGQVVASQVIFKTLMLGWAEWMELREKRKHCPEDACSDKFFKHLNMTWGSVGGTGALAGSINLLNILENDHEN